MVQQMLEKFSEYKSVSGTSVMPTEDKQQHTTVKKVALKELSNESGNINRPPTTSLLKDKKQITDPIKVVSPDSVKLSGSKRQQTEGLSSPSNYQTPSTTGINGNLVYVRRKLEAEQAKICGSTNIDNAVSPGSRKQSCARSIINSMQQGQNQDKKDASFPRNIPVRMNPQASSSVAPSASHSVEKLSTGLALPETNESATAGASDIVDLNNVDNQDWKDRFIRLQMFLKSCDQSGQEDYMQKLRSLTAAGRSLHAVELEKRAIHLLLEEGKELHRMKILNVLGKTSNDNSPVFSLAAPLQAPFPEMRS